MSRNFDLMQEMERDQAFRSSRLSEPVFPVPGEKANKDDSQIRLTI